MTVALAQCDKELLKADEFIQQATYDAHIKAAEAYVQVSMCFSAGGDHVQEIKYIRLAAEYYIQAATELGDQDYGLQASLLEYGGDRYKEAKLLALAEISYRDALDLYAKHRGAMPQFDETTLNEKLRLIQATPVLKRQSVPRESQFASNTPLIIGALILFGVLIVAIYIGRG